MVRTNPSGGVLLAALLLTGACAASSGHPGSPDSSYRQGQAHLGEGRYDEAIASFTRAIELEPRFLRAYSERGYAYGSIGQYDRAIADHTKVLEIDPRYARAYNNRGYAYFQTGQYDRAMADLTMALKLDPRYATAYLNLGNVHARQRQYDHAIAAYTRALELTQTWRGPTITGAPSTPTPDGTIARFRTSTER